MGKGMEEAMRLGRSRSRPSSLSPHPATLSLLCPCNGPQRISRSSSPYSLLRSEEVSPPTHLPHSAPYTPFPAPPGSFPQAPTALHPPPSEAPAPSSTRLSPVRWFPTLSAQAREASGFPPLQSPLLHLKSRSQEAAAGLQRASHPCSPPPQDRGVGNRLSAAIGPREEPGERPRGLPRGSRTEL